MAVKGVHVAIGDSSNSFPKPLIGRMTKLSISLLRAGTAQVKSDQCMHYAQKDRGRKNVWVGTRHDKIQTFHCMSTLPFPKVFYSFRVHICT